MLPKLKMTNSYLIFQILRFGSLLLINIIMAKSKLSMPDLGRFESFTFYASAVSFFWIAGFSQTLLSFNETKNAAVNKKLFFNTFLVFIGCSLFSSIALLIGYLFNRTGYIPGLNLFDQLFLIFYVFVYPIGFLIEFILLSRNKSRHLVIYGVISSVLTLIFIPLPVFFGFSVELCFMGLIIIAIAKIVYLLFILKSSAEFTFDKSLIIKLIITASPLVLTALLAGSASYIDGLIISLNFDNPTFAIFRYGAREFPLFLLISSSFGISMLPLLTARNSLQSNLELIKEKSGQYIRQYFPLAVILLCLSQFAFKYIFNVNFYHSFIVFDIYLLLVISRFVFPASILIGFQKNRLVLAVSLIELVINIGFSLLFVKWIGYTGVAFGTVIAYFAEKLILIFLVKRHLNILPGTYIPIKQLLVFSMLVFSVFLIKQCLI